MALSAEASQVLREINPHGSTKWTSSPSESTDLSRWDREQRILFIPLQCFLLAF